MYALVFNNLYTNKRYHGKFVKYIQNGCAFFLADKGENVYFSKNVSDVCMTRDSLVDDEYSTPLQCINELFNRDYLTIVKIDEKFNILYKVNEYFGFNSSMEKCVPVFKYVVYAGC